jgi:hypothetical protein
MMDNTQILEKLIDYHIWATGLVTGQALSLPAAASPASGLRWNMCYPPTIYG